MKRRYVVVRNSLRRAHYYQVIVCMYSSEWLPFTVYMSLFHS